MKKFITLIFCALTIHGSAQRYSASVTVQPQDLDSLRTKPKLIIPNPGPTKVVMIISAHAVVDFDSIGFTQSYAPFIACGSMQISEAFSNFMAPPNGIDRFIRVIPRNETTGPSRVYNNCDINLSASFNYNKNYPPGDQTVKIFLTYSIGDL